jgi:diguanylate cyclase (GGDEF)-like protein
MFDVDHFKLINDTLGHSAGDEVLLGIARQVQAQLRSEDILARVGGDEFAVMLEGESLPEARVVAERIRTAMAAWIGDSGLRVRPTLSIGLVEIDGEREYEALISQADGCLYRAKDLGRDRTVCAGDPEPCRPARRS